MWVFRESDQREFGTEALPFVVGAIGGLALGLLLSGRARPQGALTLGGELRQRARGAAARLRPARRHKLIGEQTELTSLEDAVLDAFLTDEVLRERGIDVGAISRGIIELSGSVWTEKEADRAVHLAGRVAGVDTVVDRLEIENEVRHLEAIRRRRENGDPALTETRWEGRRIGMGTRRQGRETDPDRPDDSQHQEERALEEADRDQWTSEGLAAKNPRMTERPDDERAGNRSRYREDQLDNQDPHGKHGTRTLDRQPQELNSAARVGEAPKPGTELRLESADLPVKPHGHASGANGENSDGSER